MISSVVLKYARALLEVAAENGREDQMLQELRDFGELLATHHELRTSLENPVLHFSSKRGIVEALGSRLSISREVQNFLLIAISNARIHQFDDLVMAYAQLLDQQRGIQQGTVSSALPLAELQRKRVVDGMEKLTGNRVRLQFEEDRDLIGGIKIRIGSTIFDGSIRARLNQLEKRLAGQ